MITIQALSNLQQAASETIIVSLHTAFSGFCSVGIEPPETIIDYFKEFLTKAKELTAGSSCNVELMNNGEIKINLILPDRIYRMSPIPPGPIFCIEKPQEAGTKHMEIIRDAADHKKAIWVTDKIKEPQEE